MRITSGGLNLMKKHALYLICIILLLSITSASANSLHKAVEEGDAGKVSQLLDVNSRTINWKEGDQRETLLHYAIRFEHLEVVKILIERGADMNIGDNDEMTPLHKAAYRGLLEISEYLLSKGASLSVKDRYGVSPLHLAAARGHNKVMSLLLDRGADINLPDNDGETPLHRAAKNGYPKAVSFLLEKGANPDIGDEQGRTALYWSVERKRYSCIAALLKADVNTESATKKDGETPLHKALAENDVRAAEMLVKGGADVNVKNSKGESPLQIAEKRKMREIVKLFREMEKELHSAADKDDTGEKQ
jgi:ankyrin repeat protein